MRDVGFQETNSNMTAWTSNGLAAIEAFLRDFHSLVDKHRIAGVERMASFFSDYGRCLANASSAGRFNVLDITGVGNDEVKHSSILAWLLAPQAAHACGTRFLELFLKAADVS